MIRSILAVVAGYVASAIVVVAGIFATTALIAPQAAAGPVAELPATYLFANLVIGLLAAVLGGWVAARLARRRPLAHAAALAGLMAVLAIVSAIVESGAATGQPGWYPYALAVVGPAGALAGGWWQHRRTQQA